MVCANTRSPLAGQIPIAEVAAVQNYGSGALIDHLLERFFDHPETAVRGFHRPRVVRSDPDGRHELTIGKLDPRMRLRFVDLNCHWPDIRSGLRHQRVSGAIAEIIKQESLLGEDHETVADVFPIGTADFESNQIHFKIRL